VVLATVCCLGALLGAAAPGKPVTALQRASVVTKTFMTAFCARQLTHKGGLFTADSHFLWAEEGAAEPGNMTVEAVLQLADEEHTHPEIKIVLSASPGQGKNLTAHLQELKAELHKLLAVGDEDDAADFNRSVSISTSDADADGVIINVVGPPGGFGDSASMIEESMREPAPTFRAKLAFGRNITEMKEHLDENPLLLPGGVQVSFSTTLGMKLIAGLEAVRGLDDLGQSILTMPEYDEAKQIAETLEAISSFGMNSSIRYRKEELSETLPYSIKAPLGDFVREVHSYFGPTAVLSALRRMSTSLASLELMEFQGLPGNWELLVKFSNFSLSDVLITMIPKDSLLDGEGSGDVNDDDDYV